MRPARRQQRGSVWRGREGACGVGGSVHTARWCKLAKEMRGLHVCVQHARGVLYLGLQFDPLEDNALRDLFLLIDEDLSMCTRARLKWGTVCRAIEIVGSRGLLNAG